MTGDLRIRMLSQAGAIADRQGASPADSSIALAVLGDVCAALAEILERLDRIESDTHATW